MIYVTMKNQENGAHVKAHVREVEAYIHSFLISAVDGDEG